MPTATATLETRATVDHFGHGRYTLTATRNEAGQLAYSIKKHADRWSLPDLKPIRRGTAWTIQIELDQLTIQTPEHAAELAAGLQDAAEAQKYFHRILKR